MTYEKQNITYQIIDEVLKQNKQHIYLSCQYQEIILDSVNTFFTEKMALNWNSDYYVAFEGKDLQANAMAVDITGSYVLLAG